METPVNPVAVPYRDAMRRLASTVTIISTGGMEVRHAITATAVTSVSMEPPSLLTCINRKSRLHGFLEEQETFCVNFLHRSHVDISEVFSGQKFTKNRFDWGDWGTHLTGLPYLVGAQCNIFCRKTLSMPYGSHTIFIGEVFEVAIRDEVAPLIYADGKYATATPIGD
ncbi:flavin reductase family protein [Paraburkholderia sediminicola]|uniref:flavin reductase family protein n=1 Tax=Paraburkholderia sediminicola TaxID=458836 RepID=UPI0038BDD986